MIPNKIKILMATGMLVMAQMSIGQRSLEILSVSGQFSPNNPVKDGPGSVDVVNGIVNLKIPVVFKNKKSIWYNDVTYLYSRLSCKGALDQQDALSLNPQGVILQTGLVQKLDEDHALQILLAPRIMSTGNWTQIQVQPGLIALFEKRYSSSLLMRYGALYNQDLFGPMLIPLVYLYYQKPGSPWSFEGLLPIKSKISYRFNQKFTAGFKHLGLVTSYPMGGDGQGSYLERKSIDLSLFGQYRIYKGFHVEFNAGYALNREYARYATDDQLDMRVAVAEFGEERTQLNPSFADGFFAGMRLIYLVDLED